MSHKAEMITCPTCGMSWWTRLLCWKCAFTAAAPDPDCETCAGAVEYGSPTHTCPEPFSYETAKAMADAAQARGGVIVTQKIRAQIRLGLERGPE